MVAECLRRNKSYDITFIFKKHTLYNYSRVRTVQFAGIKSFVVNILLEA